MIIDNKLDKETRLKIIIDSFNNMEPFTNEDDIPEIPVVDKEIYDSVIIPNLIRCGAIPKSKLVVGKTYIGDCRNTSSATWDGQKFVYTRYKLWSTFEDEINHFEDDDGHDLFVPIMEKN